MSINKLILVSVMVNDQDEALKFYTEKLGFVKKHDFTTGANTRWVAVAPINQKEIAIVLRRPHAADFEIITSEIDKELGRGTLWTFSTSNCHSAYKELKLKGVKFYQEPQSGPYGVEAIFEDLYGNRFGLLEVTQGD